MQYTMEVIDEQHKTEYDELCARTGNALAERHTPQGRTQGRSPMSEQSLADRARAERAAYIARVTRGMMLVNREPHLRDRAKGGGDA
jgi:hypothetical protein